MPSCISGCVPVCKVDADLRLRECNLKRRWRDLFRGDFDDRRSTCSVCRRTYPAAGVVPPRG